MNESRIRKAQLADADAIAVCIEAAYAHYAKILSDLPPVSEGCADEIGKDRVWVAVDNNEILGCLFLVPQAVEMKLANLAVHPDHQGKGLGRELITFAQNEARKQGFHAMTLNTHAAMPKNLQLYTRLEWEEVSRKANTISMRKILKET
ncbi:hypothetical protein GCM10007094_23010 [Pseudovibrio japonicus]|uniref:N-acetyltransferase domain-containing protein n=1 Tax=Pseudovibrio japonicus TaxID=366534 RepID=A0ABQ3EG58_9HYPH|nr:GNAT family N-acetyltransferase [Pseudovibrio japonicus]GHB33633.1 hypothetical protein GCM10007094_23010 [Pseudovibrio japonicus]